MFLLRTPVGLRLVAVAQVHLLSHRWTFSVFHFLVSWQRNKVTVNQCNALYCRYFVKICRTYTYVGLTDKAYPPQASLWWARCWRMAVKHSNLATQTILDPTVFLTNCFWCSWINRSPGKLNHIPQFSFIGSPFSSWKSPRSTDHPSSCWDATLIRWAPSQVPQLYCVLP